MGVVPAKSSEWLRLPIWGFPLRLPFWRRMRRRWALSCFRPFAFFFFFFEVQSLSLLYLTDSVSRSYSFYYCFLSPLLILSLLFLTPLWISIPSLSFLNFLLDSAYVWCTVEFQITHMRFSQDRNPSPYLATVPSPALSSSLAPLPFPLAPFTSSSFSLTLPPLPSSCRPSFSYTYLSLIPYQLHPIYPFCPSSSLPPSLPLFSLLPLTSIAS